MAVESFTEKKNLDIYPNPANSYVIVEGDDIKEVEIFDMMGRKFISTNVEETSSVISIENLTPGIYVIRSIDVNNNVMIQKFIKK